MDTKPARKQGDELLLEVAQRLFTERGYANVSMQQIAEAAGMTKGAPYYHFQNKEELFLRVSVRILREIGQLISDACHDSGSLEQRLNQLIVTVVGSMSGNLEQWFADFNRLVSPEGLMLALEESFATRDISRLLVPIFAEARATGEMTRVDPEVAARVFVSLLMMKIKNQAYHRQHGEGGHDYLEHSTAELVDIFLHGVS
ncbi:MAG: TetR/AcrR family transcriptional regulator [Thermomicrobiales bacterium]